MGPNWHSLSAEYALSIQLAVAGRETGATDGAGEGPALDGDARLAVYDVVTDLLAPLLDDFDAWMVTVEVAAGATVTACPGDRD